MEHVDCAMLYLASSVCRQSEAALAARLRRDFETMMLRAKRFAAEGGVEDRTITTYGKEVLEEMNNDIGGDCKGMSVFEDKHRVCKALAEDFTPRGRQILQDLSNGR